MKEDIYFGHKTELEKRLSPSELQNIIGYHTRSLFGLAYMEDNQKGMEEQSEKLKQTSYQLNKTDYLRQFILKHDKSNIFQNKYRQITGIHEKRRIQKADPACYSYLINNYEPSLISEK